MAVEMVDVRSKETGQKTRLPKSALEHPFWAKQYQPTPQQNAADKQKGA